MNAGDWDKNLEPKISENVPTTIEGLCEKYENFRIYYNYIKTGKLDPRYEKAIEEFAKKEKEGI